MKNGIKIKDIGIPELSIYRDLSEMQLRRFNEPDPGIFICESTKVICRALDARYEPLSLLTCIDEPDEEVSFIMEKMEERPVYMCEKEALSKLTGYNLTGGILCAMKRQVLKTPEGVCAGKTRIAVLEDVENPTNLGAIFRSAAALGIEAVLITGDCTDPLYRRAARVSMGTVFLIPWTRFGRGFDHMGFLSDQGFTTISMALSDRAISIRDERIKQSDKRAIILGNEDSGLKDDTIARSDHVVMIPMAKGVDSLNVAAASAVAFWEMLS
ncbi:MAG: RNA methyltransferase [Lachnospiraceae bacterium]|nr:RNA methyltransferase [Lachnospiraceae bacterium]